MAKTRIDDNQYKPAGADTELQYNSAGSVASSPDLTWDNSGKLLGLHNGAGSSALQFKTSGGAEIDFQDAGGVTRSVILADSSSNVSILTAAGAATWIFGADASLLFPNITTTQRNAITAAEGMQIYNVTTHQFEMYNGTIWTAMGGGGSGSPSAPDLSVQFNTSGAFDGNAQVSIVPGTATNKTLLVGVDPTTDVNVANPGFTWADLASTFGQSILVASNIEIYDSNRVSDIGSGTAQLGLNVRIPGGGSYSTTLTAQSDAVYAPSGMTVLDSPFDILFKTRDPFGKTVVIDGTTTSQPTPDHSAILEVTAIDRGFLPPRLTTLQRDNIQIFSSGYALINDYTLLAGATVTVDGTVLTEGIEWTAAVDNDSTAASLATAVDALASVTAFQSAFSTNPPTPGVGPYVIIHAAVSGPAGDAITLATSDPVNISLSGPNLTGGLSVATGLEIFNTDTLQPEFWNGTTWVAMTGSSTPAGADTQIQYNNAGAFGASPAFAWVDANQNLRLGDPANTTSDTTIDMTGNGFDAVINMDHTTGNLSLQANDGSNIVLGSAQVNVGGNGFILLRMDGSAHFGAGLGGLDTDTVGNIISTGSALFGSSGPLDASAILEIDSTQRGFLPPRMNTTQRNAIATPATGLEIYNTTTNQPEVYNGTVWTSMGGGGSPAGANTQIQFNNSGAFGATSGLTWTGTLNVTDGNGQVSIQGVQVNLTSTVATQQVTLALTGSLGTAQLFQVNDDGFLHIINANGAGLVLDQSVSGAMAIGSSSPNASAQLDMQAIDKGFLEPRLTTVQRDGIATPATGLQIYNTDTNELQFWNGTVWGPVGSGSSSVVYADDVFTYSGSNIFTITTAAIANSDVISQNGLVLRPTTDYTLSGTTLTILTSLTAGDQIQAKYATSIAGSNVTGFVVDEFTNTTGPTPVFTLSSTPIANGEFISLNGILLRPTTDYTLSGVTLTIITATTNGDFIQAQYATGTGGGGGGTPGGANMQIQFNNAGAFGGSANLFYDDTAKVMVLNGFAGEPVLGVYGDAGGDIFFRDGAGTTDFAKIIANASVLSIRAFGAAIPLYLQTLTQTWVFADDGSLTVPGQIHNVVDPTAPQDAATKAYVDAGGLAITFTTTNNTPAVAGSIALATDNSAYNVEVTVSAVGGGTGNPATDCATFIIRNGYKESSGTVTQLGTTDKLSHANDPAWDVDLVISGTNLDVTVTGDATDPVNWKITYKLLTVSN